MSAEPETWTIEHFSQANPRGPGMADIPTLLRRVAATLQHLGPVDVQDLVFHSEVTADGDDWPSITVYLHRGTAQEAAATTAGASEPRRMRRVTEPGS
jgi:hypothetical protein